LYSKAYLKINKAGQKNMGITNDWNQDWSQGTVATRMTKSQKQTCNHSQKRNAHFLLQQPSPNKNSWHNVHWPPTGQMTAQKNDINVRETKNDGDIPPLTHTSSWCDV
jgi:hypothetical protein